MHGCPTVAVSSSQEKLDACISLGASAGVNYREDKNWAQSLMNASGGKGYNVVLDPVMASNFSINCEVLAMDSRWVVYGFMGGSVVKEADMSKLFRKRCALLNTTLRSRSDEYKTDLTKCLIRDVLPHFASGEFKPQISSVYPL